MTRTAYAVQRDFALSSGLRAEITWDSLAPDQADVLRQKIANLISEGAAKHSKLIAKQRAMLFNNVWAQRKYTNRNLLSAIIYVLVTPETNAELALVSTNFSCHPVIRTRKCMNADNSDGCCMTFIDEHGRVYADWSKYVYNNALPKGTMIAPSQGIYMLSDDENMEVHLMVYHTPASRAKSKILNAGDTIASVAGLVATVPVAAALAVPLGGPVLLAAAAVGTATCAYTTVRSVSRLVDRRQHAQPTSLCDSEARGNWLSVVGGVVGLGASGATQVLSTVAASGREVNVAAQLAVKGINVSSIVISGTGVVNGVYDVYLKISDDQSLNRVDMLQIASSFIIFTHSINNLRIACKATNAVTLRRALHDQTRKILDKISRESLKLHSSDGSAIKKLDIVRILNEIPTKEVLLSLHKINSHLAGGASFLGAVGASVLPNLITIGCGGNIRLNLEELATQFGGKFTQHISSLSNFTDVLDTLYKYFSECAVRMLMEITREFVEQNVDNLDRSLNTFITTEAVLYRALMHCVNSFKDFSVEFLNAHRLEILNAISKYFESVQPVNVSNSRKYQCKVCKGDYYICSL